MHVLQSNQFSGAENIACQIIEMMRCEPDVESAYSSAKGSVSETLERKNIRFLPMNKLCRKELEKVIEKFNPDIIHAHDMRASVTCSIISQKIPIVSHIHNSDFKARRISIKSLLYLFSSFKYSKILWVSSSCFESYAFHKFLSGKSRILSNVIDETYVNKRALSDVSSNDYDIVFIGRLVNPKNPLRLIRIVEMIKEKRTNVKVGIIGNGTLEGILKQTTYERGLEKNIVFHGFMSNPLGILKSSKVLVMTSDREGLPMVALEAMALGVPIVSTPTDGLCDIVIHKATGFLESDEGKFAARVLQLLEDPALREQFSNATLTEFEKINNIKNYKDGLNEAYGRKTIS